MNLLQKTLLELKIENRGILDITKDEVTDEKKNIMILKDCAKIPDQIDVILFEELDIKKIAEVTRELVSFVIYHIEKKSLLTTNVIFVKGNVLKAFCESLK